MSALKTRKEAIISLLPAADYSTKRGYTVTHDGVTATLSASATVRAQGVILEGGVNSSSHITVGLLGSFGGTVLMKASGVIAAGAWVQQAADGTIVTDAGAGARTVIGQALEAAVAGDLIEVATCTPLPLT